MADASAHHRGRVPTRPGATLREDVLPALSRPRAEVADLLGIARQTPDDVMSEKGAVAPEMAVRLGKLPGNGPTMWSRMQSAYDLWHAAKSVDVAPIPTLATADRPRADARPV